MHGKSQGQNKVVIKDDAGKPLFCITELGDVSLTEYEVSQIRKIMTAEETEFEIWTQTPSSVRDDLIVIYGKEDGEKLWDRVKDKEEFTKKYSETFAKYLAAIYIKDSVVEPALNKTIKDMGIDTSGVANWVP
jgi:hypothetical protein